ncbi:MAG TPA: sulfatase-like hydrolase/transferase, partial [Acidobacteriota bacterium]|nr:sulfatase-like hydrolase/transferase [Acidobacteriota bacterium]
MSKPRILFTLLIATCLLFQNCHRNNAEKIGNVRNIILISIDTLRPDALSVYGGKTTTPFFDQFARRSVVFDHALTCAPITLPAHTSLLTGLYPPSHGVRNNGTFQAPSSLTLISEIAKQKGMATAAVVGGFPLSSRFGLNQGFDSYDDHFPPTQSEPGVFLLAERDAQSVRNSAQTWLTSHGEQPFFLWV